MFIEGQTAQRLPKNHWWATSIFSKSDRNSSTKLEGKEYRLATSIFCKLSRSSSTNSGGKEYRVGGKSERSRLRLPWGSYWRESPWLLLKMRSLTSSNKSSISSWEDQEHLWLSLSTYSGGKVNLAEGNLEGSGLSNRSSFGRKSLFGTLGGT